MRILFVGDVIGKPGRRAVAALLPDLRRQEAVDFVIANGENLAGGRGINIDSAQQLFNAGVDCITLGNHIYDNNEVFNLLLEEPRVVRSANLPPDAPGKRWQTYAVPGQPPVTVVQLDGRVFMRPTDCPFRTMDAILAQLPTETGALVVDIHAEATSEKVALGWYLDGRVTALVGTHTHVPTADERVLPRGTAYITDVGMTGPFDSIIGVQKEIVLHKFLHGYGPYNEVAKGDVRFCAVLITTDEAGRSATGIRRFQIPVAEGDGP
ncbi:TIGR00282 family metallophosphoesterase [bacterium]|nr:TIGR00282 family metallophosphoesterase [bacterium]